MMSDPERTLKRQRVDAISEEGDFRAEEGKNRVGDGGARDEFVRPTTSAGVSAGKGYENDCPDSEDSDEALEQKGVEPMDGSIDGPGESQTSTQQGGGAGDSTKHLPHGADPDQDPTVRMALAITFVG
jgi:hypothetical protein